MDRGRFDALAQAVSAMRPGRTARVIALLLEPLPAPVMSRRNGSCRNDQHYAFDTVPTSFGASRRLDNWLDVWANATGCQA